MTPEQRLQAKTAGRYAGLAGLPPDHCPYDPNGNDEHRALAREWAAERRRHHPDPLEGVDFT